MTDLDKKYTDKAIAKGEFHYPGQETASYFFSDGYAKAMQDYLPAAKDLIDTLEKYLLCRCTRSVLINAKNNLKKLLEI